MEIGVPKEIKPQEYRVGLTPAAVDELVRAGHRVRVQAGAGQAIGFADDDYRTAGATLVSQAADCFDGTDLVVKVKEPQAEERAMLRTGQGLFTYLHLAPDMAQADDLIASGATCIAYETVTDSAGRLPLLAPMSEVAGRMAVQAGARCLELAMGGRGVLLSGVPGVEPANVLILGGGVVGYSAARIALGMGADVSIVDRSLDVLRRIEQVFGHQVKTLYSTAATIHQHLQQADLVIGAVLVPGATAPKLVAKDQLASMRRGSVLVDVAIDQGGCFATSKPTTHAEPTFIIDHVVHYCVANMPGAVARTATMALSHATLPYVMALAQKGVDQALQDDAHLRQGLNVCRGSISHPEVAASLGYDYHAPETLLAS